MVHEHELRPQQEELIEVDTLSQRARVKIAALVEA